MIMMVYIINTDTCMYIDVINNNLYSVVNLLIFNIIYYFDYFLFLLIIFYRFIN